MNGAVDVSRRVVVAITGASGAAYGIRVLELCRATPAIETHLVISRGARSTVHEETGRSIAEVNELADRTYADHDLGAAIASGSFTTAGMIVAPCSVKTLSAVANSFSDSLVARSADVTLKERRPLVLMLRETPLHAGHIRLMAQATEAGAIVYPPVPAFYTDPQTVDDVVDHTARRALDLLGVSFADTKRWTGLQSTRAV